MKAEAHTKKREKQLRKDGELEQYNREVKSLLEREVVRIVDSDEMEGEKNRLVPKSQVCEATRQENIKS